MKNWLRTLVISDEEKNEIRNLHEQYDDEYWKQKEYLLGLGYKDQWEYDMMDDDEFLKLFSDNKVNPTDRNIKRFYRASKDKILRQKYETSSTKQ
jgi:hypothetical protein